MNSIKREHRIQDVRKAGGDVVVSMAFASELPYQRWWGVEKLQATGARLDRLNDGAPLLFNHDWNDLRGVHVPGTVRADKDGVIRGDVRITAATQAGRDAIALVEGSVLTKASVGYEIHKVVEIAKKRSGDTVEREIDGAEFRSVLAALQTRDGARHVGDVAWFRREMDRIAGGPIQDRADDEPTVYLVTDWEPLENSLVTVPADPTVGVGRVLERAVETNFPGSNPAAPAALTGATTMAETQAAAGATTADPQIHVVEDHTNRIDAVELEKRRKAAIRNLCKGANLDERFAEAWIAQGAGLEKVSEEIVRIAAERSAEDSKTFLDLPKKDLQRYSLMRALRAAQNKDWSKAGLELDANREISKRLSRLPRSETAFFVPLDVMMRDRAPQRRDMTVAGVSGSNYLVSTENMPGSFIELLRNTSVGLRMGVRRMSGLVGNVTIPKMTAGNTAYWLSDESTQITESQPTIGQLSLTPKNVAAMTELSHQLMQQSTPDAEQLVLDSIARDIALAVDVGILRGSGGSGQPTGIVNTAGIGSVSGSSLAAAGVLEFQSDVAAANALNPGCGYVTTPAVAALLKVRPELPSTGQTPLWVGNILEGSLMGFRAMSSNQMSSATALFGWWDSVILAEWGVLELMTNPYSDFTRGLTAVRGWYTCDVGLRYPAAFSYATSIT